MNLWLYWNNSFVQILIKIEKWKLNATETIGSNWKEKKKIWKKKQITGCTTLYYVAIDASNGKQHPMRTKHTHTQWTH